MRILGVVVWTNTDKTGKPIAGVRPLYEIDKDEWRPIDAPHEYPTVGEAFWFSANEAVEDSLVYFRSAPNQPTHKYHFAVADPQIAFEIIDLRSLGSPEACRIALMEGRRHPGVPSDRVILWCAPRLLIGPVTLTRSAGVVRFGPGNRDKIQTFAISEPRRINDGTRERLLRPDSAPPNGYVDWDDDAQVLKRAIQTAVNVARKSGKDVGQTKRLIDEAADAIAAQGLGLDATLHRYRVERAKKLLADTGTVNTLAPELVESLREHPAVVTALKGLEARLRGEVEIAARSEIDRKLQRETKKLQTLRATRERLAAALSQIRVDTKEARRVGTQAAEEVETAIADRVRTSLERPAELLATASILRPLLASSAPVRRVATRAQPLWARVPSDPIQRIADRAEFQRVLKGAAQERGVAPASMLPLHAAVAAGLMPITMGSNSLNVLLAYARAVCGSRCALLHTSPAFVQPHDLFGYSHDGGFEPHASGLLAAATAARDTAAASLMVFEGVNRAPLESLLVPLLQLQEAGLPFNLPNCSGEVPAADGLRLAGTFITGATSIPVTPDLWCYAVALEPDLGPTVKLGLATTELENSSELFRLGQVPMEIIEDLLDAWPQCTAARAALERFGAALSRVYSDRDRIRTALLEGIALPLFVTAVTESELEEALAKHPDLQTPSLKSVTIRLRRRLR